jgi:hypothetical protein
MKSLRLIRVIPRDIPVQGVHRVVAKDLGPHIVVEIEDRSMILQRFEPLLSEIIMLKFLSNRMN